MRLSGVRADYITRMAQCDPLELGFHLIDETSKDEQTPGRRYYVLSS